jgi:hypothetical protein
MDVTGVQGWERTVHEVRKHLLHMGVGADCWEWTPLGVLVDDLTSKMREECGRVQGGR